MTKTIEERDFKIEPIDKVHMDPLEIFSPREYKGKQADTTSKQNDDKQATIIQMDSLSELDDESEMEDDLDSPVSKIPFPISSYDDKELSPCAIKETEVPSDANPVNNTKNINMQP